MAQTRTDMFVHPQAASGEAEPAGKLKLSHYLGTLEFDPDDRDALEGVREVVEAGDEERLGDNPVRLLEVARRGHEQRAEYAAVAGLIEAEVALLGSDAQIQRSLLKELGRIRAELLLEPQAAREAYDRAQAIEVDGEVSEAIKRLEQSAGSWQKFAKRFIEEAGSATEPSLKMSLMLRAGSLVWQYKKRGRNKEVDRIFKAALEVDGAHVRAVELYAHTLRQRAMWPALAELLLNAADAATEGSQAANFYLHAARVCHRRLDDASRAAACYERVLDAEPSHAESMEFLAQHFTGEERWDDLAALYENALRARQKLEVEQALLLQISMVHWRMRERPDAAEPYFARLRTLDPAHSAVLDFYHTYCDEHGDVEKLLDVLSDAQRVTQDVELKRRLAIEIAQRAQTSPGMTERSIEAWKMVLRVDPGHAEASKILKELYAKSNKWNALVEVLRNEIDAVDADDTERKVGLLRELVVVYRDQLSMDGMVINTLNAILKLVPGDRRTLTELAERYRDMGRWNDLITVLSQEADGLSDIEERVQMYLEAAGLWIEHFSNYNQASQSLEKVLELQPENGSALSQLKGIYERKRAWKPLFEVLRKQREAESDKIARAGLAAAMARLSTERLHRHEDAIALWKEAVADHPDEPGALEALEKIAERQKDWDTLATVIERQLERESRPEVKVRLLTKVGALHADRRKHLDDARHAWQRILEIDPKHGRALRNLRDALLDAGDWDSLEAQYAALGDWDALVDVLGSEADKAQDAATKVTLSLRAARVYEEEIGEPQRALRSYERVLSVEPDNERAARALLPLYEREEKWSRMAGVTERLIEHLPAEASEERLALLSQLVRIGSDKLRDGASAFRHAARAYALCPTDESVVEQLESAAGAAAAHDQLIALYLERAQGLSGDEAVALRLRVATIANDRLGQTEAAAAQYLKVLEAQPGNRDALLALERMERASQNHDGIRAVLLHRLEHGGEVVDRFETLKELASIEEQQRNDAEAAAACLRQMAELEPTDPEVLAALDRLATAANRHDELATVLERRIDLEDDPAALLELNARLGQLHLTRLDNPDLALLAYTDVLQQEPAHGQAISALEGMLEGGGEQASAALEVLERAFEETRRFDKLAKVLEQRLAEESDASIQQELRLRLADISASELGDAAGAYSALEAAFVQQPDDRDLWDRLSEAAGAAGQQRALAHALAVPIEAGTLTSADAVDLCRRVAELHDEILGSPEDAEPFHQRVLASEPLDGPAFVALKQQWTEQERWEDLLGLYTRRVAETVDADDKLELLLQMCFLYEEILDRLEEAIETYRAVVELHPDHVPARRALERLYEQTGRFRELSELLRENLGRAEGPDQVDIMFRLGQLYEAKLGEPESAVDQYEAVLAQQPTHLRSQNALAGMLTVQALRQRVAATLEPLYESQGAWPELAGVLEIQLERGEDGGSRSDLLMRIGELQESRLRDPEAAFAAYARVAEMDPADERAREAMARVSEGHSELLKKRVEVLSRAADAAEGDRLLQGELLLELSRLLDESFQDPSAAERAYERLIELDRDNEEVVLEACRALERIHIAKGDHVRLAQDLERQLELDPDEANQRALLARLAELYDGPLSQPEQAIAANRRRLELDHQDEDAMARLEDLLARTSQWQELVEALQARAQFVQDEDERRELGVRIGRLFEEQLDDPAKAIEAYTDHLASFGPQRDVLKSLCALYERTDAFVELLGTLAELEALEEDPLARAELGFKTAEVLRLQAGEPERAIEYYERVLEEFPEHAASLAALDEIIASQDSALRRDAARVVAPRHEAAGRFVKLLAILDVQSEVEEEEERLLALRRAAEVADSELGEAGQAFGYLGRAIEAGVSHEDLGLMLEDYDRLAGASGRWSDFVGLLRRIAPEVLDPEVLAHVLRRVATVGRDQLADNTLAREYFEKLLAEQPEDGEALDALEALTSEAGDHAAVIEVLRRKAELAFEPNVRHRLMAQQADIHERIGNGEAAIEVLEELVVEAPAPESFSALERLYTAGARYEDLAACYEQQLGLSTTTKAEAVQLRYQLAKTCHEHLNETHRALDFLRDAVTADANHRGSIELLERLLAEPGEYRPVAAEILEAGYLARMEWPKLTGVLEAQLEEETDESRRKRLLLRLAQIYEDQLEDYDGTFELYARMFSEDPRDEDNWETLMRLARVNERWERLGEVLAGPFRDDEVADEQMAKLAKVTGSIFDERVSDMAKAAHFYALSLAFDPTDVSAFRALEAAYERGNDREALLSLYARQADVAESDEQRIELMHKRAHLLAEGMGDREGAVTEYRRILDISPTDPEAGDALDNMLQAAGDHAGLAEHLRNRIDYAADVTAATALKLRLSDLLRTKLDDLDGSIDVLDEIVQMDPRQKAALARLEELVQGEHARERLTQILEPIYRQLDQWKKLIAVHEAQLELGDDPAEGVRLLSEVASLHEERGGDASLAMHAFGRALLLEPDNEEVRQQVDRLAGLLNAWDAHVETYEAALKRTEDPGTISTLLLTIARVQDEKRSDAAAAIRAYERMLENDREDPTPLDPLEGLQTMVGDWPGLVRVLERKVELSMDVLERGELLRRIAAIYDDLMSDRQQAVASYKRAIEEDDADQLSWEALDRLYTQMSAAEPLAGVLARRLELASDPTDRITVGLRLGALYHHHLHQPDQAIEAYRHVMDDDPRNGSAIAELAQLYERQGMWSDLLENLEQQATMMDEPVARAQTRSRMGLLLEQELSDAQEAVARYRDALADDPEHESAINALMRLSVQEDLHSDITELLDPLLRDQGRYAELIELSEQAVGSMNDPFERRGELVRIAELQEQGREDKPAALNAYVRALAEARADEELQGAVERLAAELSVWDVAYDSFFRLADAASDPEEASALFRRAGRIAEQELADDGRAMRAFIASSERDDDASETLVDLDRLYLRNERFEDLLDVLERRIAASGDVKERIELLLRLGELRKTRFADAQGAFVAYREVVESDPTEARALEGLQEVGKDPLLAQDALDILDDSYRQLGDMRKVAELYDLRMQLAETDSERVQMLLEASGVWEHELADAARAQQALIAAARLDPADESILADVERLSEATGDYEPLRGLVEQLLELGGVDGHRRVEMCERAAEWYRSKLESTAGEEHMLREILAVEPQRTEVQERLLSSLRHPGRERETVDALLAWARSEGDAFVRADLLREAATLSEEALQDMEGAGECYTGVLEADPDDLAALDQLIRIRASQERHRDMVSLLAQRLDRTVEPEARTVMQYRQAEAYAGALGDSERAIAVYQEILANSPEELAASVALEALLSDAGRHAELQTLLEARLEFVDAPDERVEVRVRLATLAEQQFGDRRGAISQLQEILAEEPRHPAAGAELERLLRAAGRHQELAEQLTRRADLAAEDGRVDAQVEALRELSAVREGPLSDVPGAIDTWLDIHGLVPEDTGAMTALGRLCRAEQRFQEAADFLHLLMLQQSGGEALATARDLAELAEQKLEDFARAEATWQQLLRQQPGSADARAQLRAFYERTGNHARVVEILVEEAKQDLPTGEKVAVLRRIAGLYQQELGEPAAAVPFLEEATKLVPDDRDVLLALCDLYISAGREPDAIPVLERIIESYGGRRAKEVALYHHQLGRALEGMGQIDEAFARYDAAFKIDLTNPAILRDLGRVAIQRGDFDRAQKTYRALLLQKLGPAAGITKAEVYFHLGQVSYHQGDQTKARAMLQRAISEAGQYPEAEELLSQLG
ncbi:MAG: tetratricopeptide repeat protein [Myxococcales bacterium]|nr:tetratricopeptide repeat protein [Myxococcales bacterium]